MNLILLEPSDFIDGNRVRLQGRRLKHVLQVHRASTGDRLRVGLVNGKLGHGIVERLDTATLEMRVELDREPPPALQVRLILAVPRPKMLNRTIAAAVSMGIREIDLINSWRVEKSYWDSPKLLEENLELQSKLGLEQAGDTMLPTIRLHKIFTPFVREQLPQALRGSTALLAHPEAETSAQRASGPIVLAIGPEGGFIDREVETFLNVGFTPISLGPRILRVETALPFLIGRLF